MTTATSEQQHSVPNTTSDSEDFCALIHEVHEMEEKSKRRSSIIVRGLEVSATIKKTLVANQVSKPDE